MAEYVVLENTSLSQRSFKLRSGEDMPLADALLVVVPGRDPKSGQLGMSDPVPRDLLLANSKNPGVDRLFEEGILNIRGVN